MPQSSAIFAFVAIAFLVFITQRGELRSYMGFFFGTTAPLSAADAAPQTQSSLNGVNLNAAVTALEGGAQLLL